MILVIGGICAVLMIVFIVCASCSRFLDDLFAGIAGICAFGLVLSLLVAIVLGICVSKLNVIDDKIAMYEEQNTSIETQIAEVVEQYQKYETDIFTEVAPESAITLVAMYPDLKSDALVESQINVYVENNKKITELKEQRINGSVLRWWLYFGGKEWP